MSSVLVPSAEAEHGKASETAAAVPSTSEPVPDTSNEPKHDEPENALTKQFTADEWSALKEFRSKLPTVFGEACSESETKKTSVKLWGVPFSAETAKSDPRVSVLLMKFLRARNLNITEAQSMLVSTLKWRESFKVEEVMKETFDSEIFGNLGRVYGKDKDGRPVTYNLYGGSKDLKAVFSDVPRFIRWRVQLMEHGVAQMDFQTIDQMLQVHDYEGVSLSSRDANSKAAASQASELFQDHYPEMLSKKFFVNIPTLLTWLFWVFKPLMSAKTLEKTKVVGRDPVSIGKELLQYINPDQLPDQYGGDAKAF